MTAIFRHVSPMYTGISQLPASDVLHLTICYMILIAFLSKANGAKAGRCRIKLSLDFDRSHQASAMIQFHKDASRTIHISAKALFGGRTVAIINSIFTLFYALKAKSLLLINHCFHIPQNSKFEVEKIAITRTGATAICVSCHRAIHAVRAVTPLDFIRRPKANVG